MDLVTIKTARRREIREKPSLAGRKQPKNGDILIPSCEGWANAAAFLASSESDFLTGLAIAVSGGTVMSYTQDALITQVFFLATLWTTVSAP